MWLGSPTKDASPAALHDVTVLGMSTRGSRLYADVGVERCERLQGMTDSSLDALVEQRLGSVVFVWDYVQLDFGDARFTAYVWPTVAVGNVVLEFGEPGYRDALCAFIEQRVTAAEESPERGLVIRFDSGEIVTNPKPTDLTGPEIAQLHIYDPMYQMTDVMVWRPGEDTFAGGDRS